MALHLRNPHSVLAALASRPEEVIEIRLSSQSPSGAWADVVETARIHRIPVVSQGKSQLSGRRNRKVQSEKTGRPGIAEAVVKERRDVPLETLMKNAENRAGGKGLLLALDCLQDPHNVGAIFRSAAFFGVQGVVVTKDRSSPLNSTVYDVASGGIESVPFSLQTNLSRALKQAKRSGLWVLGTSEHAETDIAEIDRNRPWLLILGNEERGLRRLTLERCDEVCKLSPRGAVTSLNVSAASGILIAALTDSV